MKHISMTLLALAALVGPAEAVTVQPHRAIYDLKLLRAEEKSGVVGVDGRLAFEITGSACEGYTVNFRMVNQYQRSEGNSRLVDSQSTSFEAGDSTQMQYSDHEYVNSKEESQSRVSAERKSADADGHGEYGTTDKKAFTLPAGALFPIQHQIKITTAAEQGMTRDESVVFDGSDSDSAFKVITFISPKRAAGHNDGDNANPAAAALAKTDSWPVSLSYYKIGGEEQETPSYQVSFNLYDNGVATGLTLDYGDFVLRGELTKLDYLDSKACP